MMIIILMIRRRTLNNDLYNFDGLENINIDIEKKNTPLAPTQNNGKKRKRVIRAKDGVGVKLSKQLDCSCDFVEYRQSISMRKDEGYFSIAKATNMLQNMPEIARGSELFMLAAKLFLRKENKEIFVTLKDHELQSE